MRRKLQWLIVWRLVINAALLATVLLVERGTAPGQAFGPSLLAITAVVGVLSLVYFLTLRTRIPAEIHGYAQLSADVILVTWLVYSTGSVESPFLALYLVIIFAASSMFGRRQVFILASFAALLYAANAVIRMTGVIGWAPGLAWYEGEKLKTVQFMLALNIIAIIGVSVLSSHLADRLRRSEDELAIAARDLADYRAFNDRIIESMRSGLVTTDLRGNIITFNKAAEEITGYRLHELRGKRIFTIFGDIEKQIEVGLESIRARSRLPRFDIACRTADGRELHLGFSVAPLVDEAKLHSSPTTRGYVLTFQDLTEVMELEREVRRQERLAALGKMAAGLAHEIRNPLASMRGSVQVLAAELDLSPDQAQLMEIVLRESDRLNQIVSDFLVYARPPRTDRQVIDLAAILSETLALLRHSPELSPNHFIVEECDLGPVLYNGDPNQLRQVFWNLARNAIQAMPAGGKLTAILEATPRHEVTITFSDTGQGMTREQQDRLFEPFNSSTGGTGLGMAIVYQLIRDHNGRIVVESEAGSGTRISIRLPGSGRIAGAAQENIARTQAVAGPSSPKEIESTIA
ncbi:MAG TPA: ATP-binding protein [Blastocatellia bacterium]|nr:ATP-binding protein [Blastocatellia bacterium]